MATHLLSHYKTHLPSHWAEVSTQATPDPYFVIVNHELASQIGFPQDLLTPAILTANEFPHDASPIAMAYSGHQFGNFSPSLGDGRAMLLGEILTPDGALLDVHLKGSGKTFYSRGADGKAALGPMLREYLMSEAMHAFGIATTRSLAVAGTGAEIYRHDGLKPAAVLTRIAKSHIRVGSFQFFASRQDISALKSLADYTIARLTPALIHEGDRYVQLLKYVANGQAELLAKWMGVGFIHGVMNTDNMSISCETIDYGPCAFMDFYEAMAVFSSIDHQGRYAYANQPRVAQWNLARFAESLLPLMGEDGFEQASKIVTDFELQYQRQHLKVFSAKLGLENPDATDADLIAELLELLEKNGLDFTGFFRNLPDHLTESHSENYSDYSDDLYDWIAQWRLRVLQNGASIAQIKSAMNACNPIYIPRNHLVEEALVQAEAHNNLAPFLDLLEILKTPFAARENHEQYAKPAPISSPAHVTFCGT